MTKQRAAKAALTAALVCLLGAAPSGATFHGANGLLVYQAQTGKHIQLFTVRADGTGRRQITDLRDSDAIGPEWSPDGRQIVFARDYALGTRREHLDIARTNADGGALRAMGLRGRTAGRRGRRTVASCGCTAPVLPSAAPTAAVSGQSASRARFRARPSRRTGSRSPSADSGVSAGAGSSC